MHILLKLRICGVLASIIRGHLYMIVMSNHTLYFLFTCPSSLLGQCMGNHANIIPPSSVSDPFTSFSPLSFHSIPNQSTSASLSSIYSESSLCTVHQYAHHTFNCINLPNLYLRNTHSSILPSMYMCVGVI